MAKTLEKSRAGKWRLTSAWLTGERYPAPRPYVPRPDLPGAYLVDIDGTVALNNGHRSPFNWAKVGDDEPNWSVIQTVQLLGAERSIVFLSGRDEVCRADTWAWLHRHFFLSSPLALFMRPHQDMRPDCVVKSELFDAHVRNSYNVLGVFDDRRQVIDRTWRAMGLTAFDVAGNEF